MRTILVLLLAAMVSSGCASQKARSDHYPIHKPIDPVTEEVPDVVQE